MGRIRKWHALNVEQNISLARRVDANLGSGPLFDSLEVNKCLHASHVRVELLELLSHLVAGGLIISGAVEGEILDDLLRSVDALARSLELF